MGRLKHNGEDKHPELVKREARQKKGESLLDMAVEYWEGLLAGEYTEATHGERIRAAENIANRFGLPIRTDVGLPMRIKVKTVEMRGYVENGKLVVPEEAVDTDVNDRPREG